LGGEIFLNLIVSNLQIVVEKDTFDEYILVLSKKLGVYSGKFEIVKILNKTLNIKNLEQFYYDVSLAIKISDDFENKENFPEYKELGNTTVASNTKKIWVKDKPIIIGFGPAGIFAAIELIDNGIKPIIFERGKKIEERYLDVKNFIEQRVLNIESNIQFGEGGAGSYSDGKLFSRANNSVYVNKVLNTFIRFGAPCEIEYIAKPHLGTDVLCKIVCNMRNYILENGGQIHYSSKMTELIISGDKAVGVRINDCKEYFSSIIYLAVGHSARDTFKMIYENGVVLEQKPISVGVRIEHPAKIINLIRYGAKYKNFSAIGAANYSFTYTNRKIGRGVYTFCMCPGGEVVNASSENGLIVVNGMSYSVRASEFSNSAIVVTCHKSDYKSDSPMSGIEFQRDIEQKAFIASGCTWQVPAQNLMDYLSAKISGTLNKNSCKTGTVAVNLYDIFPQFVNDSLLSAFKSWKKDYPLFVSNDAILLGPETRTTCPIKITRNKNFESVNIKNLYPIGEGSGYSGGITSSAVDGIRVVEAMLLGTFISSHLKK